MSVEPPTSSAQSAHHGLDSSVFASSGVPLFLTSKSFVTVAAILVLTALAGHLFGPRLDEREPPPLKSRVPFIGHLIGMITAQSAFLTQLAARRMPIATLPILNGKMYAVWDANLIQAVLRNKHMSFVPFAVEFARRELDYTDEHERIVKETGLMGEFFEAVHAGMSTQNTNRMNVVALKYVAERYDAIGPDDELVIPNLFIWARDLMTMATCEALYGPDNPMRTQPQLLEDIWTFETQLPILLLHIYPSITASKGHTARKNIQTALSKYYGSHSDEHEGAAGITRHRAAVLRKFGVTSADVGIFELALLHVGTANTIPTLFWLLACVLTRPDLIVRLRDEALAVVDDGDLNEVTVDIGILVSKCPLLVSCYREAIRISNVTIEHRRVMADTIISDGKGQSYLLKEGINVSMPSDPLHHKKAVWGDDSYQFSATRFMDEAKTLSSEEVKARRASYIPFGGGKHLCPGRNFALAENLGFLISLVLGFEVSPIDGNWETFKEPPLAPASMAAAACKPKDNGNGFGMRLKRRKGWEKTKWTFTSS